MTNNIVFPEAAGEMLRKGAVNAWLMAERRDAIEKLKMPSWGELEDKIVLDSIEGDARWYAIEELKSRHSDEYLQLVAEYADAIEQLRASEDKSDA